jgi:tripartite-type tricarboxylate transporter receptor subunit TctC
VQTLTRRAVLAGFAACPLLPRPAIAHGQALRIVFPFAPGGSADSVARLFAEQLQTKLGSAVIVENRAGAAGRIGAQAVKESPPDGSVLLFGSGSQFVLQPHIQTSLGYDPFVDFIPISQVISFDVAMAVSSQLPIRSVKELIEWIKANPAQAVYGSPGIGTVPHFACSEFGRLAGLDLRHVAYRATSVALPDLLTGRILMHVAALPELLEQHRSGGIRILATASRTRSSILPEIPTLMESGSDVDASGWYSFYAPARTPDEVVARLMKEIVAVTTAPEVRMKILTIGFEPTGTTSDELRRLQQADFERWGVLVKASGFRADN